MDEQPTPLRPAEEGDHTETDQTPPEGVPEPVQPEVQPLVCEAAFIVYKDPNSGRWLADSDISKSLVCHRAGTLEDIFLGGSTIVRDMYAIETAQRIVTMQRMQAQQMMEQMEAQQMAQKLANAAAEGGPPMPGGIDLSALRRQGPSREQRRHPSGG